MKEFNLEKALAGEPVITRNGELVTQITKFEDIINPYCLCGKVLGNIELFTIDGVFSLKFGESQFDLFMAEEKKSIWINVWKNFKDGSLSTSIHSRKDKCDMEIDELLSHTLIKSIEITE